MLRRRIAIVDDDLAVIDFLRLVFDVPDVELVGHALDGVSALELVAATTPEVLVLDLDMPLLHGTEVARSVRNTHPHTWIIVRSSSDASIVEVPQADAFIPKSTHHQVLLDAIRSLPRRAIDA